VEKTNQQKRNGAFLWKHLHGRGEDQQRGIGYALHGETPPRAWRRLTDINLLIDVHRNTSTGVEKTPSTAVATRYAWKHLHGRGEDLLGVILTTEGWETPPRAWRRHLPQAK